MGRRPLVRSQAPQTPVAGFTPEVQAAVNDVAMTVLAGLLPLIKDRIARGDFEKMKTPALMAEVRKMIASVKGPSTSITAIQIPTAPQAQEFTPREARILKGVRDPEELRSMRKRVEEADG